MACYRVHNGVNGIHWHSLNFHSLISCWRSARNCNRSARNASGSSSSNNLWLKALESRICIRVPDCGPAPDCWSTSQISKFEIFQIVHLNWFHWIQPGDLRTKLFSPYCSLCSSIESIPCSVACSWTATFSMIYGTRETPFHLSLGDWVSLHRILTNPKISQWFH